VLELALEFTQLSRFLECPRKYRYSLEKPEELVMHHTMFLGGTFHLLQHIFFTNKMAGHQLSLDEYKGVFANLWDSQSFAKGKPIDWGSDHPDSLREMGLACATVYYPIARSLDPVLSEQRLMAQKHGILFFGIIDLVLSDGSVVDFKTAARFPTQPSIDVGLQPLCYAYCAGGPITFKFHYIKKDKVPVFKPFITHRTKEHIDWFEDLIVRVKNQILQEHFPPNPTNACKWCDFKATCRPPYYGLDYNAS
jgi:hypothetical protein